MPEPESGIFTDKGVTWYKARPAQEYLGVSPREFATAERAGNFVVDTIGKRKMFSQASLDAWLENRETAGALGSEAMQSMVEQFHPELQGRVAAMIKGRQEAFVTLLEEPLEPIEDETPQKMEKRLHAQMLKATTACDLPLLNALDFFAGSPAVRNRALESALTRALPMKFVQEHRHVHQHNHELRLIGDRISDRILEDKTGDALDASFVRLPDG